VTLATAGGLSALIHGGHGIAVAEALTVSKGDFAITFAITALTCTTCTEAEFIESFALNLAGNQVFKGIFVGLTESERLNQARIYAIAYINSIKQTASYGKVVGKIGEFGNKVSGYWQLFLDKIKSLVQVTRAGNWGVFSKIKMKITTIDTDGWLMGKYVNGELQVIGKTNIAQKWDYIVKTDGQILVGRKHSWLSQGKDVLAAGELKYNNGKLVEISNASGHYLPSTSEASNFLRVFRTGGVNVDNATLTILKEDGTIFKQVSPTASDRLTYY
jgi:hypothetical protein